jgi:hypothetical protein
MSPFDAAERQPLSESLKAPALGTRILDGHHWNDNQSGSAVENPLVGDRLPCDDQTITVADTPSRTASGTTTPNDASPSWNHIETGQTPSAHHWQNARLDLIAEAKSHPDPKAGSPRQPPSDPASSLPSPNLDAPDQTLTIVALWRQRQDLKRAYQRLDLQCQSVCRRFCRGDKAVASKLWAAIQAGAGDDDVAAILTPYRMAMAPLATGASAIEKQIAKMVRKLSLWTGWAKDVRGLGELSLASLIGEANAPIGDYRSVSGLWKRMGLAVIDGERQRKITGDAALVHGYSPQRRAVAYVLATNLMRSQGPGGPYRAIYDARKAYELAREIPKAHAHNRALRHMVKALIKDAWRADRPVECLAPEPRPNPESETTTDQLLAAACLDHELPPKRRSRPSEAQGGPSACAPRTDSTAQGANQ